MSFENEMTGGERSMIESLRSPKQNAQAARKALHLLDAATARAEAAERDRDEWHAQAVAEGRSKLTNRAELKNQESATQQLSTEVMRLKSEAAALRAESNQYAKASKTWHREAEALRAEVERWQGLAHEECQRRSMADVSRDELRAEVERLRNDAAVRSVELIGKHNGLLTSTPAPSERAAAERRVLEALRVPTDEALAFYAESPLDSWAQGVFRAELARRAAKP